MIAVATKYKHLAPHTEPINFHPPYRTTLETFEQRHVTLDARCGPPSIAFASNIDDATLIFLSHGYALRKTLAQTDGRDVILTAIREITGGTLLSFPPDVQDTEWLHAFPHHGAPNVEVITTYDGRAGHAQYRESMSISRGAGGWEPLYDKKGPSAPQSKVGILTLGDRVCIGTPRNDELFKAMRALSATEYGRHDG